MGIPVFRGWSTVYQEVQHRLQHSKTNTSSDSLKFPLHNKFKSRHWWLWVRCFQSPQKGTANENTEYLMGIGLNNGLK